MKKIIQFSMLFLLFATFHMKTGEANELTDENTPISFQIELLPWEEVNELLPNKSKFSIIDVETGLQFEVQRRAGSKHADVQPLTFKDTKIMKKVYRNRWSWKRRAIIVLADDQMIAASMSGMPHGAGALKNGFPGHFCVHFYKSKTHTSNKEDLAHQLMTIKAAGKLSDYLSTVSPEQLMDIFVVTINQADEKLMKLIGLETNCPNCFRRLTKDHSYFSIRKREKTPIKDLKNYQFIAREAVLEYFSRHTGKETRNVRFIFYKPTPLSPWLIDGKALFHELFNE